MLARHYHPNDAASIDLILNHTGDVRLDRDRIYVLGDTGKPTNLLTWRPGGIVHELRVGNGLGQKQRADSLVNFAIADSLSRPFHLYEAIFLTDSERMSNYALSIGAMEEKGKRVFTLPLR
jgi:hypothetical protein